MFDYEVLGYRVEYQFKDGVRGYKGFPCEEAAALYIERNRPLWDGFRLLQVRTAIIF